ncbi:MAG: class II fumarate hydratase [Deltaproteobacteria bacterium]|nr:class II fumarate hydratase [Deltaproteobacteria bacterium]
MRIEKDTMGWVEVPDGALYGAQTARAVENFPISGATIGREMIAALALIKKACASVNHELGRIERDIAEAIIRAADEVARGELDGHFPVDVFQTGSGTSSNMNANEVIANRAIQLLGGEVGSKHPVHPNDHVNLGQSSNDVFPTAIHLAALSAIKQALIPALKRLEADFLEEAQRFDRVVKIARTHLQDATPIRLGQEFSGFASQLEHGVDSLLCACEGLSELPIGGTAVGTGINTHPFFGQMVAEKLSRMSGFSLVEAKNHFEAQSARDAAVRASGSLRSLAVSLIKIADHIRWLASGPRMGLGELILPEVQPGSSIMPGKVNPVIAESLIQAAVQVIGNDNAITVGGLYSHFQLNTMQPLIARNLLEQIRLLTNAVEVFDQKLVKGLQPNLQRIASMLEQSLSLATALTPYIGYEKAAEIAKLASAENKTVREIAEREGLMPAAELDRVLDPKRQTEPGW